MTDGGFEQNGYRIELSGAEPELRRALCEALLRLWRRQTAGEAHRRCENGSGVVE